MKIAHTTSKAAAGGPVRGRSLVCRLLACALIGGAAMSVAHAGPQRAQQRPEYSRDADQRRQQRADDRQQPQDEEPRREDEQPQANEGRRNGRMTADERRDLRRQINEAGADIYQNKGRRR